MELLDMARMRRGGGMSIEALQTAAEAAGYVMLADDDGSDEGVFTVTERADQRVPGTAVAVYEAHPRAATMRFGQVQLSNQMHAAWAWVSSRWATGAPA